MGERARPAIMKTASRSACDTRPDSFRLSDAFTVKRTTAAIPIHPASPIADPANEQTAEGLGAKLITRQGKDAGCRR
jgi:hypothetical protein